MTRPLPEWTEGGGQESPGRDHRLTLDRVWDNFLPHVLWVMLNPSKADARKDDPTIRKCIGFSDRWGYGSLSVVNLFTFRATDPRDLLATCRRYGADALNYPVTSDLAFMAEVRDAHTVVVAWGAWAERPFVRERAEAVAKAIARAHDTVYCIGRTKNGHPIHPLMARYTDAPEVYRDRTKEIP